MISYPPQPTTRFENVHDRNYIEFTETPAGILIFGSDTCIDCHGYNLIMEDVAREAADRGLELRFGKVLKGEGGLEGTKELWALHQREMSCIPHTALFQQGQRVHAFSDVRNNTYVKEQIETFLGLKI